MGYVNPTIPARRILTVVLSLVIAVLAVMFVATPPASAHSAVGSTSPSDGENVATMPSEIAMAFNENVTLPGQAFKVIRGDGSEVPVGEPQITPEGNGSVVRVPVERGADQNGWYAVSWSAISGDGHPIQGTFTFTVGTGTALEQKAEIDDPTALWRTLTHPLRAVIYLATLIALGSLAALWSVAGTSEHSEAVRGRLRKWIGVSAAIGLVLVPLAIVINAIVLNGGSFDELGSTLRIAMQTTTGVALLIRTSALFGILAAVPLLIERQTRKIGWVVAIAATAGLVWSFAMSGHASVVPLKAIAAPALAAHLIFAGMWLGALPGLGMAVLSKKAVDVVDTARTFGRFSKMTAYTLGGVFVAGIALCVAFLSKPSDLWSTFYGLSLVAKVGLIGLAAGAGAFNHFVLVPSLLRTAESGDAAAGARALGHLRRSVRLEAFLLIAVAIATATLTSVAAPKAAGSHQVHLGFAGHHNGGQSLEAALTDLRPKTVVVPFGDGEVQLDYLPGKAGRTNTLTFTVTDAAGSVVDLDALGLRLVAPAGIALNPIERTPEENADKSWTIVTRDLALPGAWTVELTGKYDAFSAQTGELTVEIVEAS